jgi:hypothetical protein
MLVDVSLRPQYTDWKSMREAASAVDELGFDWLPTLGPSRCNRRPSSGIPTGRSHRCHGQWGHVPASGAAGQDDDHLGPHLPWACRVWLGASWFGENAEMYGVLWPDIGERLARLKRRPRSAAAGASREGARVGARLTRNVADVIRYEEFERWRRVDQSLFYLHGTQVFPEIAPGALEIEPLVRDERVPSMSQMRAWDIGHDIGRSWVSIGLR